MCRKHYARFVFDLVDTLEAFIVTEEVSDLDMPPEEEDGILAIKDKSAITKSGFYEAIMLAKRELQGAN